MIPITFNNQYTSIKNYKQEDNVNTQRAHIQAVFRPAKDKEKMSLSCV